MSSKVLAVQELAFSAIVTVAAQFRVVSRHLVAEFEALDCAANLDNDSRGFMARDYWHFGIEIAVVNV